MCRQRTYEPAVSDGPREGETVRLTDLPATQSTCAGTRFPWWVFWTIWPLIVLFKSAAYLGTPILAFLSQPIVLNITPLPLLLIGVGVLVLLADRIRRSNRDQGGRG
jgi:hypothetical protein